MDGFEYEEAVEAPRIRRSSGMVWNILTGLVLFSTVCLGGGFMSVMVNPYSALNPFPPPAGIKPVVIPSATPTIKSIIDMPPTWTPTPQPEPTSTFTPRPTKTPLFTETPFVFPTPTEIVEATLTPGGMSFVLQQGSPKAVPNIYHLEAGCSWMGVGGQALDLRGAPVVGLIVQLGGWAGANSYEKLSITGTAPQYGQGGFEFQIEDKTVASNQSLWLQLFDQAGLPLSEKIYFDTFNDCDKNLVVVYFSQVR